MARSRSTVGYASRLGQSQKKDGARTYVICENGSVIGYYSVCAFSVSCEEAPPPARLGAYPVPAVLLARLAVDEMHQGTGIGATLLIDALLVAAKVSDAIGARMMVVHAQHDPAASYYRSHGFKPFAKDPLTLCSAGRTRGGAMSNDDDATRRRSARINLRLEPDVDEYLRRAANLEHKSLNAFMLDAAFERARRTVEEQSRIELSAVEFSRVLDELDRPAEVVAPLLKLVERAGNRRVPVT